MNVRKESGTMNRRLKHILLYFLLIFLVLSTAAGAEPVSQEIILQPGWNAIFLEVQPGVINIPGKSPTDPENVFDGIQELQSVWQWNHRAGNVTVEFIQNPDLLVAPEPMMLAYLPGPGGDLVTNLFAIHGNSAYLVKIGGSGNQTLTVTGEPQIPRHKWKSNSFNFVGFHVDNWNAPTYLPAFFDFFNSSPAHSVHENGDPDPEIYVLNNSTSSWDKVTSGTDKIKSGEAFWIYCNGSSSFEGPISVTPEISAGLHFGTQLPEQDLLIRNDSENEQVITLSLPAPLNDNVYYWTFDDVNLVESWELMSSPLDVAIAPGDTHKLRIGVKRAGLAAGSSYQENIEVTDFNSQEKEGIRFLLPISVTGVSYGGLWTGYVTIDKVSDQNKITSGSTQDTTPLPTGSQFDFRIIVHVSDGGEIRLLSQVIQMWEEGTLIPDPDNPGGLMVDVNNPGQFVLFSDDNLIGSFQGSALRDGQQIGRRISAPVFPRLSGDDEIMGTAGIFPEPGSTLTRDIILARDNKTNPFFHLFHKAHGQEDNSLEIQRKITMSFTDEDDTGAPITGLSALNRGSSEIGGIYEETIGQDPGKRLHKLPIYIKGTFVLHRVSNIATLTQ